MFYASNSALKLKIVHIFGRADSYGVHYIVCGYGNIFYRRISARSSSIRRREFRLVLPLTNNTSLPRPVCGVYLAMKPRIDVFILCLS
jgi:hypothetical protein